MNDRVPAEVFPPGEYIKDELDEREWTQSDLAEILGRPVQLVNEIVLDKRGVSPETAKGLAEAFGTSAQLWLNLDSAWQLYKSRNSQPDPGIARRARLYSTAPVKELVKRGWLEFSTNTEVLEKRILDLLFMESLDDQPALMPVAARMSTPYEALNAGQWAWLCRARHIAMGAPISGQFRLDSRDALLNELRPLLANAEDTRHVPRMLSSFGIRFVVIEHLAKTRIDGACLWLSEQEPVIVVSIRYDRIDYFWFTLMHELAHVFAGDGLRGPLAVDIDLVGDNRASHDDKPDFERSADEFAEEALISRSKLEDFMVRKGPLFSELDIRGFASVQKIHPGLVVGQLHFRGVLSYSKFRNLLVKVRDTLMHSAVVDGWGHSVPSTL